VLAIGWKVFGPDERLKAGTTPDEADKGDVPLNGWVMIDAENHVTVVMAKAEMGQGVHTGAAMILAEELGADWAQVRVVQAPVDAIYVNRENLPRNLPIRPDDHSPLATFEEDAMRGVARYIGSMVTGGSTSIIDLWAPMREAGASARAMLCEAAAKRWCVPVGQCQTKAGRVLHSSGCSATFGELVAEARKLKPPSSPKLKSATDFTLIGQGKNRIEARGKLDGSARFGIDVHVDDLLYASIEMCPTFGGTVKHIDTNKIVHQDGIHGFHLIRGYNGGAAGVAVIAENPFIAMRALCELPIEWNHGRARHLSSEGVRAKLLRALDSDEAGTRFYETGYADAVLKRAREVPDIHVLEATYGAPYLAHAALEPLNCTVQVKPDSAEIWVSTQVPMAARKAVSKVLGLREGQVHIHEQFLGGGFGRRLEVDFISQAAAIARHAQPKPVQTIWSRAQDTTHDFYRPACMARFRGAINARGRLIAWRSVSACQSISEQSLPRTFGTPHFLSWFTRDATMAEGGFDQPYECDNVLVTHHQVHLPVPVGYWRSVGHSHQAFFVESFIDEMATLANRDPIQFRLDMLRAHPRHARVLRTVAELSGWRASYRWKDRSGEYARGVAMHESFGSVVAQVAVVRKEGNGEEEDFRVTHVYCVIDCGLAINPNMVEQQMESGIVFGLSAALRQAITLRDGQVQQRYFSHFPLVGIDTCPDITVRVLDSELPEDRQPQGVGETATPPIAPAVANALFALFGRRFRELPLLAPPQVPDQEDTLCNLISTGYPPPSPLPMTPRCSGSSAARRS